MFGGPSQFPTTVERGNQIAEHSSDNETVLGNIIIYNSRKLREVAEYLIDGGEKRLCRSSFEF